MSTGPQEQTIDLDSDSPELTDAGSDQGARPRILERGRTVGRYVITDTIGQGGMGVVYVAYDPELDRKVALKLLRTDRRGFKNPKEAQVRLLREARALARLAHPNVIAIYDVQTFEDQVVLAMEYVDGQTLGAWLDADERSWREIVVMFAGAGRGLAAAHAAEVVHRDFKPSNVLIGNDVRPRVLDFGLARPVTGGLSSVSAAMLDIPTGELPPMSGGGLSTTCVTSTGDVVGTPLYMSPEQHLGRGIDARSDQFSFCVALYIALFGQRPFSGRTRRDLARSTIRGDIRELPRSSKVPPHVKAAVRKGLARRPEQRFGSMEVLLSELRRDPERRNKRIAAVLIGGAALIGVGTALPGLIPESASCSEGGTALGEAWDSDRVAAVEASFKNSPRPFASAVLDRVRPALNDYAGRWGEAYEEACEATRVRGEQSERLMDLKMACLDRRRRGLDALTDVLRKGDDEVLRHAITAVANLEPIDTCRNLDGTEAPLFAVDDAATQAELDTLLEDVARVAALTHAGKYADALPLAQRLEQEANDLGHRPMMAEARLWLGLVQARAGQLEEGAQTLASAEYLARASRHDALSARVLTELTYHTGHAMARYEEAQRWAEHADAAIERVEGDGPLRGRLLSARGNVLEGVGKYEDARTMYERSLAMLREHAGPESPAVARAMNNLGNVSFRLGELARAKESFTEAYRLWSAALGEEHPDAVMPLVNLATVELELDHVDLALENYQKVLALWERNLGADHPKLAIPLNNLAVLYRNRGDNELALEHDRRALQVRTKALGPEHAEVAMSLFGIAMSQANLERWEEAAAGYKRALTIREKALGADHPKVGETLGNLSLVQVHLPQPELALDYARRGLENRLKAFGPDNAAVAYPWYQLGVVYLGLDRPSEAISPLERVLAIRVRSEVPPSELAAPRFDLARAYLGAGHPKAKAREAAEQAIEEYRIGGNDKEIANVEKWIEESL